MVAKSEFLGTSYTKTKMLQREVKGFCRIANLASLRTKPSVAQLLLAGRFATLFPKAASKLNENYYDVDDVSRSANPRLK